ncbi:DUF6457 domain-containing protein [Sinomonas sp. R1AF57]|jgi:hypothetical protein|uniref:DUF6457 domain-containing protein n=1 Tax=Sinomonas sp. R1AF57 TaxID=2020377 RepID=UPI000B620739|nr:DUF6457 domain-containing protein [Sinomonas sp. R1AF57]ASN51142.1 molybdopterin-guanine dinucleotide biosynthesis protein [Sinomonas sp. R1AF57]
MTEPSTAGGPEGGRQDGAPDQDAVLRTWCAELAQALGLEIDVDIDAVLGLAGVAAHSIVRPAAPLTTYLVGYAAGLAATSADAELGPEAETPGQIALRLAKAHGTAGTEG